MNVVVTPFSGYLHQQGLHLPGHRAGPAAAGRRGGWSSRTSGSGPTARSSRRSSRTAYAAQRPSRGPAVPPVGAVGRALAAEAPRDRRGPGRAEDDGCRPRSPSRPGPSTRTSRSTLQRTAWGDNAYAFRYELQHPKHGYVRRAGPRPAVTAPRPTTGSSGPRAASRSSPGRPSTCRSATCIIGSAVADPAHLPAGHLPEPGDLGPGGGQPGAPAPEPRR